MVGQAVGKAGPWFMLGVMIVSCAVRALYIESSAMCVRGGVYRVVKEAMGGTLAKLSVSALRFDYSLTGPRRGVAAGVAPRGALHAAPGSTHPSVSAAPEAGLRLLWPGIALLALGVLLSRWL